MRHLLKPILLAAACLPLLVGCEATPVAAPADPYGGSEYQQIVLLQEIKGDVRCDTPVVIQRPDAPLHVSVAVRNVTHDDMWVQYQFTFKDRNGQPMRPEHAWQRVELRSSMQVTLEDSAGDNGAVDWNLTLGVPR